MATRRSRPRAPGIYYAQPVARPPLGLSGRYFFLFVFAIIFLSPPVYMLIDRAQDQRGDLDLACNPWIITRADARALTRTC